jgi:hypothetical protein
MRVLNRIAYSLLVTATVMCSATASPQPVLSVCELIQHPDKWEGKIVSVKGAIPMGFIGEPSILQVPLRPQAKELCKYSDSTYVSADERPEVWLAIPDNHVRGNPPPLFAVNDSSFVYASNELRRIYKDHPSLFQVIVVVDGFVSLRKYNLRQFERDVKAGKSPRPQHTFPPVILTVEAYRSVQIP